ncbi:transglycosylase [Yersinia entomophaga]|uniref:Transglycosylase n=1 Tax=Yersinia entomophaga TaxID=935293 RepID=A0ABM6BNR0_YERET|nr:lytic transglycosylase domain-containing protein [Yersinia entomophaga]ANI31029.1 transglycosylase [Yersinia entomophaga]
MMRKTFSNLTPIIYYFLFSVGSAHSTCLNSAAEKWNVPSVILESIISQESSWKINAKNKNENGSHDIGLMQINSINISLLQSAGIIDNANMLKSPCINIQAGAYLLSLKFKKYGYSWKAVGAYHSETPRFRDKYAKLIMEKVYSDADLSETKSQVLANTP